MKYNVREIGTYYAVKEIEAEDKEEARRKYIDDPALRNEYGFQFDQLEIEEQEEK